MHDLLDQLYRSTAESMRFGIGRLLVQDTTPAPCIQVRYASWPRVKLELIRKAIERGVIITGRSTSDKRLCIHIATTETVTVSYSKAGETSALRAPAWSAELDGVASDVWRVFEEDRCRLGGYLLIVQTDDWEFVAAIDAEGRAEVATITRPTLPFEGEDGARVDPAQ